MAVQNSDREFKTFGQWLRYWREVNGLSQRELAKMIGKTPQYISNLENEKLHGQSGAVSLPRIQVADKLAKIFKRPVAEVHALISGIKESVIPEVVADEVDLSGLSHEARQLLNEQLIKLHLAFIRLPTEKRAQLLEFIEMITAGYAARSIKTILKGKLMEISDEEEEILLEIPKDKDRRGNLSQLK